MKQMLLLIFCVILLSAYSQGRFLIPVGYQIGGVISKPLHQWADAFNISGGAFDQDYRVPSVTHGVSIGAYTRLLRGRFMVLGFNYSFNGSSSRYTSQNQYFETVLSKMKLKYNHFDFDFQFFARDPRFGISLTLDAGSHKLVRYDQAAGSTSLSIQGTKYLEQMQLGSTLAFVFLYADQSPGIMAKAYVSSALFSGDMYAGGNLYKVRPNQVGIQVRMVLSSTAE